MVQENFRIVVRAENHELNEIAGLINGDRGSKSDPDRAETNKPIDSEYRKQHLKHPYNRSSKNSAKGTPGQARVIRRARAPTQATRTSDDIWP